VIAGAEDREVNPDNKDVFGDRQPWPADRGNPCPDHGFNELIDLYT
jgi:hypothetical protein